MTNFNSLSPRIYGVTQMGKGRGLELKKKEVSTIDRYIENGGPQTNKNTLRPQTFSTFSEV